MSWASITVVYFGYLVVVAWASPGFARARPRVLTMGLAAGGLLLLSRLAPPDTLAGTAAEMVVPAAVLLLGYWASGAFFVRPMTGVERRLLDLDDRLLVRTGALAFYERLPAAGRGFFELSYLSVHVIVLAGAPIVALGAGVEALQYFWSTVLLSGFACYAFLPWIQTRPPRALGTGTRSGAEGLTGVRRLNEIVLSKASIQVNTCPSGHAAVALGVALVIGDTVPSIGALVHLLAASIIVATVVGRYHYLLDSVLGALVATLAWLLVHRSA